MSVTLLKILADFTVQLSAPVAIGDTTANLSSANDDDGNALPTGLYGFTIDGGQSNKEYIVCTLTGTAITGVQSITRQGVATSGFSKTHRRGAKVSVTDWAILDRINDLLNGSTGFDATGDPLFYDGAPASLSGNELITADWAINVLPENTDFITNLTNDPTFQNEVNNFVTGGGGGSGSSGGKPMTFGLGTTPITGYLDTESLIAATGTTIRFSSVEGDIQSRDVTTDWASAAAISGAVLLGIYLYVMLRNSAGTTSRVYRYTAADLSTGGSLMTISGFTAPAGSDRQNMTSNGTHIFINYFENGNPGDASTINKFSLSGTTLTFVSDVTCGTGADDQFLNTFAVDTDENYYGVLFGIVYQYDDTGTLAYTSGDFGTISTFQNWTNTLYGAVGSDIMVKLYLPDTEDETTGTQTKTVNVSSAEILALHTTPKELIPAPGAGKVIVVSSAVFSLDAGTQYAGGSTVDVNYGSDTTALVLPFQNMQNATDAVGRGATNDSNLDITPGINQNVELKNNGSAFTTGTGTLKVFITYQTITL